MVVLQNSIKVLSRGLGIVNQDICIQRRSNIASLLSIPSFESKMYK